MKRLLIFLFIITIIFTMCLTIFAHSGRTDSNGGHKNNSTGEYHYHCGGHPAHQHPNGTCPYDKQETKSASCNSDVGNTIAIIFMIAIVVFYIYAMFSKK